MSIFDTWAKKVGKNAEAEMQKKIDEAAKNNTGFTDLPDGVYPVKVDKLEVATSSWGTEQVNITFKVLDDDAHAVPEKGQEYDETPAIGNFKDRLIFYNGTFDDNWNHGINATAVLLAELIDGELTAGQVGVILSRDKDDVKRFLSDALGEMEGLTYDLKYTTTVSKKLNPNTQKPYTNHFFSVAGIYED